MASEAQRGCGYRKVGALYLVSDGIWVGCDRLPYELKACPVCGAGIHLTRSMTAINPFELFGMHDQIEDVRTGITTHGIKEVVCQDEHRPCKMCDPTNELAYIQFVGKQFYSPISFVDEANKMGVSNRIAQIPKGL